LLVGSVATWRDRRALTASLANAQKVYIHTIRESAFRLPATMLQPSNPLDFWRQRHHVNLSALMWMLTFWPRDERSPFSFLACNLISFDRPGHVGHRLKIPLPPRRMAPAQRKTNN
jgi:hypothetical protein